MRSDIENIFSIFSKDNSNPQTELVYNNNFTLLVAVVLSAQTTDVAVNKATADLFSHINTPRAMAELGEEGLKPYIKSIGLYNMKAKNIIALSKQLIEKHNSIVPSSMEALTALPGVGRKTANVVLACAFGHPTIAVDTHVFRVSHRLGLAHGNTPEAVEKELLQVIPAKFLPHAHHWLILHGRYVCQAKKPRCSECKIKAFCKYARANNLTDTSICVRQTLP